MDSILGEYTGQGRGAARHFSSWRSGFSAQLLRSTRVGAAGGQLKFSRTVSARLQNDFLRWVRIEASGCPTDRLGAVLRRGDQLVWVCDVRLLPPAACPWPIPIPLSTCTSSGCAARFSRKPDHRSERREHFPIRPVDLHSRIVAGAGDSRVHRLVDAAAQKAPARGGRGPLIPRCQ